jgi:hypothetical protein
MRGSRRNSWKAERHQTSQHSGISSLSLMSPVAMKEHRSSDRAFTGRNKLKYTIHDPGDRTSDLWEVGSWLCGSEYGSKSYVGRSKKPRFF